MTTPLAFCHGPLPMRSRALTKFISLSAAGLRAEIGTPGPVPRARGLRQRLAVRVRAVEPAEVGALAGARRWSRKMSCPSGRAACLRNRPAASCRRWPATFLALPCSCASSWKCCRDVSACCRGRRQSPAAAHGAILAATPRFVNAAIGGERAGAGLRGEAKSAIFQGSLALWPCSNPMLARTLYDKLFDGHVVRQESDGTTLLYIDRHLVHEVTSPQAFEGLKLAGRKPWRADVDRRDRRPQHADEGLASGAIARSDLAHADRDARRQHAGRPARKRTSRSSTAARASSTSSGRKRRDAARNDRRLRRFAHQHARRVRRARVRHRHLRGRARSRHAVPDHQESELDADPRRTAACTRASRRRTSCWRSSGASAPRAAPAMRSNSAGDAVRALSMEGRMTMCNMSIEAGARAGMIGVDEQDDRLRARASVRAGRRDVRARRRALADARERRRREVRR